jgi:NADH:ubiquinone oxidoreductase subunit 5 (subunit L)/multisubunit Na+/H+ antiporter MnhA subunit
VVLAWFFYMKRPDSGCNHARFFRPITRCSKTSTTSTNSTKPSSPVARACSAWSVEAAAIVAVIDGVVVNGSAKLSAGLRSLPLFQTGYIYQLRFSMIIGVCLLC